MTKRPETETMRVWRVELLTPKGRINPFQHPGHLSMIVDDKRMTARCVLDPTHVPPVLSCRCGIYGVGDLGSTAELVRFIERSRALVLANPEFTDGAGLDRARLDRPIVVPGILTDPVPNPGRGVTLIPIWSDRHIGRRPATVNLGAGIAAAMAQRFGTHTPPPPRVINVGCDSDPVNTWRGSSFTMTGPALVGTVDGDEPDWFADQMPVDYELVPMGEDDEQMSHHLTERAESEDA